MILLSMSRVSKPVHCATTRSSAIKFQTPSSHEIWHLPSCILQTQLQHFLTCTNMHELMQWLKVVFLVMCSVENRTFVLEMALSVTPLCVGRFIAWAVLHTDTIHQAKVNAMYASVVFYLYVHDDHNKPTKLLNLYLKREPSH